MGAWARTNHGNARTLAPTNPQGVHTTKALHFGAQLASQLDVDVVPGGFPGGGLTDRTFHA